jgi:hypothetical protein
MTVVAPRRTWKHRLVTVLFLIAALACYAVGLALPATAMLIIGAGFELTFWVRLLRRRNGRKDHTTG